MQGIENDFLTVDVTKIFKKHVGVTPTKFRKG